MQPEPVVAFITTRLRPILIDIRDRIETYEVSKQRGVLKDGRPFIIATHANHLRGTKLLDYEIWNGYNDLSSREMQDIAEMRMIAPRQLVQ